MALVFVMITMVAKRNKSADFSEPPAHAHSYYHRDPFSESAFLSRPNRQNWPLSEAQQEGELFSRAPPARGSGPGGPSLW